MIQGAVGAQTHRSLGYHLLHPQILRLLVLLQLHILRLRALEQTAPSIQIPNACPNKTSTCLLMFKVFVPPTHLFGHLGYLAPQSKVIQML